MFSLFDCSLWFVWLCNGGCRCCSCCCCLLGRKLFFRRFVRVRTVLNDENITAWPVICALEHCCCFGFCFWIWCDRFKWFLQQQSREAKNGREQPTIHQNLVTQPNATIKRKECENNTVAWMIPNNYRWFSAVAPCTSEMSARVCVCVCTNV